MYRGLRRGYADALGDFAAVLAVVAGLLAFALHAPAAVDKAWAAVGLAVLAQALEMCRLPFLATRYLRLRRDVHMALPLLVALGTALCRSRVGIGASTALAAYVLVLRLVDGGCIFDLLERGQSRSGVRAFWKANAFFLVWIAVGVSRWATRSRAAALWVDLGALPVAYVGVRQLQANF